MEEISDHAKNLTLSEDLEKPLEDRVNLFYSFVKVRVPRSSKVQFKNEELVFGAWPLRIDFIRTHKNWRYFSFSPITICSLNVQNKKESGTIDAADKEILAEAERLDVKAMGPLILSELLFNENIRDQIKKYKRHFLRVSHFQVCAACSYGAVLSSSSH